MYFMYFKFSKDLIVLLKYWEERRAKNKLNLRVAQRGKRRIIEQKKYARLFFKMAKGLEEF